MWYIQQKLLKSRGHAHRSWTNYSISFIQDQPQDLPFVYLLYPCHFWRLRIRCPASFCELVTEVIPHIAGQQGLPETVCSSRIPREPTLAEHGKGFWKMGRSSKLQTLENVTLKIWKRVLLNKEDFILLYTTPPFYNLSEFPKSDTDLAPVVDLDFRCHDRLLSFPCGFSLKMAANKTNFADISTRRYIATAVAPAKFVEVVDSLWCFLML